MRGSVVACVGGRRSGSDKADIGAGAKVHHGKHLPRSELRNKFQIVKERTKRAAKKAYQQHRTEQRRKRAGVAARSKRKR